MSVTAEVEQNNYTPMKYRSNRIEEDERELAELEAERNKSPEQRAEEDEDANLDPEEATFKKRYGDLRRHMQRTQEESNRQLLQLQEQVKALTKKQVKLPKSDEELDAWAKKYPDVAKIVVHQSLDEVGPVLSQLSLVRSWSLVPRLALVAGRPRHELP